MFQEGLFPDPHSVRPRGQGERRRGRPPGLKHPEQSRSAITVLFHHPVSISVWFQTQVMYKWMEPKICLEGVADAEPLPPSGEREPCPPCNPGFYNNDTATCSPCPPGTYSDGMKRTEGFVYPDSSLPVTFVCLIVFFIAFSSRSV